jgi:protein-tyrosine-phosphatase/predicted ATP-grasp superfamily ATP-dependent carboligase
MKKILILGQGTRSFLSVIRSLGRKGIIVHTANSHPLDLALNSKYISKYFQLSPYSDSECWKSEILEIVQKEKYDLIIPTDDSPIILLRQILPEIEQYCKTYLLDEKAYSITNSKLNTYTFCQSLGIRVPRFSIFTKNDESEKILESFDFPIIIKPVSSYSSDSLEKKYLVKIAENKYTLSKILQNLFLNNPEVIIQEYFEGIGLGIEVLVYQGEILMAFQHIRIHEKPVWSTPRGGASSYRKSQAIDNKLMSETKKIMKELKYTGVAMVEFRKNYMNNQSVLIEINGRFWGSLPLAVAAGADFPYNLCQMLLENQKTFPRKYKENIFCRNTTEDLYWIYDEIRFNRSDLKIELRFIGKIFVEFFNIFLLRERNDTLVLDDPKPWIMEMNDLVLKPFSILNRKIRAKLGKIKIYRKIRANRFKRAILHSKSILFVCTGNICRSPFAEYYSRSVLPDKIQIFSSGCAAQNGRESPPEAIMAAEKFGIDLSNHKANRVTEEIIRKSDLVIVFDEPNYISLSKQYKKFKYKIWFLSEICPEIPYFIDDPFRGEIEKYEKVFSATGYCIDTIKKYLG